ncbi:MAG: autotransporter domain-containing protein [Deltaproteobacteria bacterium]|nr:autotransporter domain-containing protein [Deltaproteobacteria bacterium]
MKLKNTIKHSFITAIFFIFGLCLCCAPAVTAATEADIYVKFESFTWKEYSDGGSQLLKESGPISTLGVSIKSDFANSLTLKAKGELFMGSIDYDGQTQAGTPVNTDTDYSGFKIEADIGKIFMVAEKSSLEPFAGLGWKSWLRDLKSTSNAFGYEETWSIVYAQLGVRGDRVFSKQLKIFAEAGLNFPIYNENVVDLGGSTVTIEPGKEVSLFAEAGFKWRNLKASFFYEGMRFSKSGVEFIEYAGDIYGFYQPESKADIFGVRIGIAF